MAHTTTAHTVRGLCTPAQHAQAHRAKPVILLALSTDPHGKTSLLEFPEGRHPLFANLQPEDRHRLARALKGGAA